MKTLDKKILKLYQDFLQKEKIAIHRKNLEALIETKKADLEKMEAKVAKESGDVINMESLNLFTLFQKALGNHEQMLEKERQEYLEAFLCQKAIEQNLVALKEEIQLVDRMLSGKFSVKNELDKLLKEKEKRIKANPDPKFALIFEYAERLANHQAKIVEIQQAIKEGKNTQKTLQKVVTDLATLDRWHQGIDYRVSARGASQLRRIEKNIYKANNNLQRFQEELLDLHDHFSVDYKPQIDLISNFFRQLVDSLITDWVVQQQLHHSLSLIANICDKITLIISMLEQEIEKTSGFIALEKEEKRGVLLALIEKENQAGEGKNEEIA